MKEILLIGGKARSGKDYIANCIKNSLEINGKKVLKLAFADTLKQYLCILFNIDLETLNELKNSNEPFTKNGVTMRQCLQRLGTDIFLSIDKHYWVKETAKLINNTNYDYYIISDFRFPHEINISDCVDSRIYTINILNNQIKSSNHSSEIALSNFKFDYIIDNSNHNFNLDKIIEVLLNY